MLTIAVDAMGGDHAPKSEVEGAIRAAGSLGVKVILVGREEAVRRELDKVAKEEGVSRSDVLRQSLEDFLFVRRFRRLRQRMMAAAQAEGIYTDEDVFTRVS